MWAGGGPRARELSANYVLYWEMMREACLRGCASYHLGRSTADSGAEDFKKKWNAESQQLYWYYHRPDGGPMPELNVANPEVQAGHRGLAEAAAVGHAPAWARCSRGRFLDEPPMSFVAPAGTPLDLGEIASGLWQGSRSDADLNALHAELARLARRDMCRSFSSGRAAMVVALRAMKAVAGSRRTRVVIPGYTCYSVAAALENTGLDAGALRRRSAHAVARPRSAGAHRSVGRAGHHHRQPLRHSERHGGDRAPRAAAGAYLLDDAAQSLGASLGGTPAGGFGDVGLYSFDKGKNIPTMQGGALVARRGVLSEEIERQWSALPFPTPAETCMNAGKLAAYSLLLKPAYFGLVRSLPGLKLGQTPYELEYPITRYSPALAGHRDPALPAHRRHQCAAHRERGTAARRARRRCLR